MYKSSDRMILASVSFKPVHYLQKANRYFTESPEAPTHAVSRLLVSHTCMDVRRLYTVNCLDL